MEVALRGGSVKLMEQVLRIEGRDFRLMVPQDVEAIMEMYIDAGVPSFSGPVPCTCYYSRTGGLEYTSLLHSQVQGRVFMVLARPALL